MSKFEEAFFGCWDILYSIWNGFFKLEIFDSGFTFADVLFSLALISLSLYLIRFFASAPAESGQKGIKYKK